MTHAELLTLAGYTTPTACPHQVARLGVWLTPDGPGRPLRVVTTFRCRHCDRIIEVSHDACTRRMRLRKIYPDTTALWPRRSWS